MGQNKGKSRGGNWLAAVFSVKLADEVMGRLLDRERVWKVVCLAKAGRKLRCNFVEMLSGKNWSFDGLSGMLSSKKSED
jgi:hypothetical protein